MSARSRLLAAAAAATASMALLAALRPRLLRRACRALSTCASLSSLPLGARVPPPSPPAAVPPSPVRVALCQLAGSKDKQANIAGACQAVRDAAAAGAQLVVLPEMWNCPYENASFPLYAEDLSSADGALCASAAPSAAALSAAAAEAGVVLVGGSLPERDAAGRLFNTCLVFDAAGRVLAKHRKVHLFDIDIPGGITFRESDTLSPGDSATVVDTAVGRLGIGICFDLRFPELAMLAANRGAQILVYPGAFNTVTGPLHWELLLRARAVDSQLFVLACSPARVPGASYQAYGHSTAVGPFGEILATTEAAPGMVLADLELAQIAERRRAMPLQHQRRGDLYAVVDRKAAAES